ncbi:MAG TPA: hypothetical protein VFF77_04930 [Holophagaceae bacterium]|nr:hypothetical protein [Holophagaceae bacterium]
MAIFALLAVIVFVFRSSASHRNYTFALNALVKESQAREQALLYSLEKSREDRIRLESILAQNTEAWRDSLQALARVAAIVEARR